ncbi:MAG: hypothetical protein ABI706_18635, partial [Ilumatobacteraceae bacterium]
MATAPSVISGMVVVVVVGGSGIVVVVVVVVVLVVVGGNVVVVVVVVEVDGVVVVVGNVGGPNVHAPSNDAIGKAVVSMVRTHHCDLDGDVDVALDANIMRRCASGSSAHPGHLSNQRQVGLKPDANVAP